MMDPQEIQSQIDKSSAEDQYGVANTPLHAHNGTDSLRVSFSNLRDRVQLVQMQLPGSAPATAANYCAFFVAPFKMQFTGAALTFGTKGSDGSAVTMQIERLTGVTASGSGTNLLGTAFNLKGSNNTTQYGTFAKLTQGTFVLNKGDRLGAVLTGTPTALANLVLVCTMTY